MRDHKFGREFEAAYQLHSMFNAFALDHARGLQEKVFARLNAKVRADALGVGVGIKWRGVEVHHVGDHARGRAITRSDLLGLDRVDDHMSNRWQVGRECSCKIISHAIDLKALALPMKIMMMRDGGETCLRDKFRERQTKRQVEGNRHSVLDDENFQIEVMREFV